MPVLASDLTRLANEGAVIVVRNTQPGITVFSDAQLNQTTEWAADGDPGGNHIRECSSAYLLNTEFRQNVLRGIFVLEDGPEVLINALEAQRAEWASRVQARSDSAATLERMADRTIGRGLTCIAPRGKSVCGNMTLVLGANPAEHPPLCSEHAHLVNEYAMVETGRMVEGKPETMWRRASRIGAR